MEQIIYADILFVVNFSMDFLALYLTAFFLKLRFSLTRATVSAFIGGAYGVLSVVLNMEGIHSVILTALCGILMCLILNDATELRGLVKTLSVFLVSNLIIGGGMTVIFSAFNSFGAAQKLLIYGEIESVEAQLPLALFAVGCIVVTLFLFLTGRIISSRKQIRDVKVYIECSGRKIECEGISDSGNLLTEPISGLPVVILGEDYAEGIISHETVKLLTELKSVNETHGIGRIRFIICNTVAGQRMLGAFKPDKLMINGNAVSAWVAVVKMGEDKSLNEYGAIVPSEIIG